MNDDEESPKILVRVVALIAGGIMFSDFYYRINQVGGFSGYLHSHPLFPRYVRIPAYVTCILLGVYQRLSSDSSLPVAMFAAGVGALLVWFVWAFGSFRF